MTRREARFSGSVVSSTTAEAARPRLGQQEGEGAGGVAEAALPGDDGVADVAEDVRRQSAAAGARPAQVDRARAKLAVPHPAARSQGRRGTRLPSGRVTVAPARVVVLERGEEAGGVVGGCGASCSVGRLAGAMVSGDQPRPSAAA